MPPVCTCGYAIANGKIVMLSQAAYLFILNAYFIYLSAGIILSVFRVPKINEMTEAEWKKARFRMIRNTVIIVIPSLYLLSLMI